MIVQTNINENSVRNRPAALRNPGVQDVVPDAGAMVGSGGLRPTAQGASVRLKGGQVTVIDGPFTEAKEVVGGYAQFELKSKKDAIESAVRSGHRAADFCIG